MNRFVWLNLLFIVAVGLNALVMKFGWGQEPQSWAWIIGCTLAGCFLLSAAVMLTTSEPKE